MSKFTSLIRRAPKRFSALALIIAAVVIVPVAVNAWGPNRDTFTMRNAANHIVFNSITDNPSIGDERNFVGIRETTAANKWYDTMEVQEGKEYLVRMYVHNNAATNLGLVAENVTAKFNLPNTTAKSHTVTGYLSASNVGKTNNGDPGRFYEVWDEATFTGTKDFNLSYIKGSLKYENNHFGPTGTALPESIFTGTGAKLGYDKLDGRIPGCFKYSGYVTFKVKPQMEKKFDFGASKKVSKHGENKWVEEYKAKPGETVDFLVEYKNTGETEQSNVTLRDQLPKGLTYVNGSTKYGNATYPNGTKASDGITTSTGINVGKYAPGANAWAIFSAKVDENDKLEKCATNKLVNKATVSTGGYKKEDEANVIVDKNCKPTPAYECKSLGVTVISDTKFRFTVDYNVQNATFKEVTYIIRDANGTEIDRKTSTSKTLDYTRTTVGKYTVQAVISVTIDGQTKTATSENCKKPFEVPAKPVTPVVKCDSLSVSRLSRDRTKFLFTTEYTAQNATFTGVTYVIRNANGTEVDRKTSTEKTLEYTQTTTGKYSVQAIVSFTVNGETKTATGDNCKKEFEVPAKPEFCPIPGKEHLPKDSPECKVTPCPIPGKEHLPKDSPDCVTPPETCPIPGKEHLPKDSAECVETPDVPPELPQTGTGENIVAFLGLGSLIASVGYYIASRRALS